MERRPLDRYGREARRILALGTIDRTLDTRRRRATKAKAFVDRRDQSPPAPHLVPARSDQLGWANPICRDDLDAEAQRDCSCIAL
jgi:hypothetical protein